MHIGQLKQTSVDSKVKIDCWVYLFQCFWTFSKPWSHMTTVQNNRPFPLFLTVKKGQLNWGLRVKVVVQPRPYTPAPSADRSTAAWLECASSEMQRQNTRLAQRGTQGLLSATHPMNYWLKVTDFNRLIRMYTRTVQRLMLAHTIANADFIKALWSIKAIVCCLVVGLEDRKGFDSVLSVLLTHGLLFK